MLSRLPSRLYFYRLSISVARRVSGPNCTMSESYGFDDELACAHRKAFRNCYRTTIYVGGVLHASIMLTEYCRIYRISRLLRAYESFVEESSTKSIRVAGKKKSSRDRVDSFYLNRHKIKKSEY